MNLEYIGYLASIDDCSVFVDEVDFALAGD